MRSIQTLSRLSILVAIVAITACGDDDKSPSGPGSGTVDIVRQGNFSDYPSKTVGQLASCYFGSAKWEAITATDGNTYVNLTGRITYLGDVVNASLQFRINGSSWEVNAFEMNDIPQNALFRSAIIADMKEECG
jgi:hypothetical protein